VLEELGVAAPQGVADHRHGQSRRPIIGAHEGAPARRLDAEHVKASALTSSR
jgi:hypothetical protein